MQKSKYDIGEEAVHRFSLSYEDRATLALAEWVDDTFKRASVRIILKIKCFVWVAGYKLLRKTVIYGHDISIIWV